jgi:hypothetical protein
MYTCNSFRVYCKMHVRKGSMIKELLKKEEAIIDIELISYF